MQALKVAARCGRACQHKDNVAAILASAETFDTVERVATDMKLFLEEDREGPALVPAISKRCAALGREVLAQVVEDMGCMEGKDSRVSSFKDYLTEMSKRCDLSGLSVPSPLCSTAWIPALAVLFMWVVCTVMSVTSHVRTLP